VELRGAAVVPVSQWTPRRPALDGCIVGVGETPWSTARNNGFNWLGSGSARV